MSNTAQDDAFAALYARYRALPEGSKAEIVSGEIRALPRPRPRHVRAASVLGIRLGGKFGWDADDGPGGWVILDEPELRMGEEIRVPDLAGWRVERHQEPDDGSLWVVLSCHGEDDIVAAEPFDAVPFDLGLLWRLPGKRERTHTEKQA